MHIEIITTPNEALKESGFGSLKACKSVLASIQKTGFNARLNVCKSLKNLHDVVKRKPDLVVLAVKYIPVKKGEDIWLSEFFAQHEINYTGSSREVLKFDSNKVLAKTQLINRGIKTAKYFIAIPGQYTKECELPIDYPLFIKPLDAANGNGIDDASFVSNFTEYESKVLSLYETFKQPALVEEYLDGREFTVAVIKSSDDYLTVSAIEVIPPVSTNGLQILGSKAKRDDSEMLIKISDHDLKNRVASLAIEAFNALGVRDFGRIDIKTNKNGECFFIEANLVPGMTYGSSYFPKACDLSHAFSYDKVIELMLESGYGRASSTMPPIIRPGSGNTFSAAV